jgi:hypothetical protein
MLTKTLVIIVFFVIVASLGLALRHLLIEGDRSPKTVKALTLRIGLSIALFFLLLLGYQSGVLQPHGLRMETPKTTNPPAANVGK